MKREISERIREVLSCEAQEIEGLKNSLSGMQLEQVKAALSECRGKVILTGCGTSGTAAKKISHTLNCIEVPAMFLSPAEGLHGGLGAAAKEDIVVLISKGGKSFEIDSILNACKRMGIVTIAVTENENTYLAQNTTMQLFVKVSREPDAFNMLATASTMAVIAVFDALAIEMAEERNFTKEHFFRIHPGGEVGERLQNQLNG